MVLPKRIPHVILAAACFLINVRAQPPTDSDFEAFELEPQLNKPWLIERIRDEGVLDEQKIGSLFCDRNDNLWVASNGGLIFSDGYRWKRYGVEHGLPSDFVRCVIQDDNGDIWVGTDSGVGVFDGKSFDSRGSENWLAGPNVRRIRKDPDGTLWFSCDLYPLYSVPGGLTAYKDGKARSYGLEDGIPSEHVFDYFRSSDGHQFAITPNGLAMKKGERWEPMLVDAEFGITRKASLTETVDGRLIAIAADRYYEFDGQSWSPREFADDKVEVNPYWAGRTKAGKNFLYGTDNETGQHHMYRFADGVLTKASPPISKFFAMHDSAFDSEGRLFISSAEELFRIDWEQSQWSQYDTLPMPRYSDRFDRVWFGGYPERVVVKSEDKFYEQDSFPCILAKDGLGNVWGFSAKTSEIRKWDERERRFDQSQTGIRKIGGIASGSGTQTWVYGQTSDAKMALAVFDGSKWASNVIAGVDSSLILDAVADPSGGVWLHIQDERREAVRLVHLVHSDSFELLEDYELPMPLLIKSEPALTVDRQGRVWLSGEQGLFRLDQESKSLKRIHEVSGSLVSRGYDQGESIVFLVKGATNRQSYFARYRDESWQKIPARFSFYNVKRPFIHYINATVVAKADKQGNIYAKMTDGLAILTPEPEQATVFLNVPGYVSGDGIVKDSEGQLWIGSSQSNVRSTTSMTNVSRFKGDLAPPDTEILSFQNEVRRDSRLEIEVEGRERFRPRDDPNKFLYSWRINEDPWTGFQPLPADGFDTTSLPLGTHTLEIRAMDPGMDIDPYPAKVSFDIYPIPLQQRSWFYPVVLAALLIIAVLAAIAIERAKRLSQMNDQLEQRVAERTAELEMSMKRAEEADSLKSAFLANLSHEIRTPLNAILGFSSLMNEEGLDPETRNHHLNTIEQNSQALLRLIEDILDFSMIESNQLRIEVQEFSLNDFLESVSRSHAIRATSTQIEWRLNNALQQEELSIRSDHQRIRQIIDNLVNNAFKFTKEGCIEVGATRDEQSLSLYVKDTGRGIRSANLETIFKRFTKLQESETAVQRGVGLGLSISQRLAHLMGGDLTVESNYGKGSCFFFKLPLSHTSAAAPKRTSPHSA